MASPGAIRDAQRAVINAAAGATTEIVAAVAGRKIRVVNLIMRSSTSVSHTWKSAATALSGTMWMTSTYGYALSGDDAGTLATAAGEALNVTLAAGAGSYQGALTYVVED